MRESPFSVPRANEGRAGQTRPPIHTCKDSNVLESPFFALANVIGRHVNNLPDEIPPILPERYKKKQSIRAIYAIQDPAVLDVLVEEILYNGDRSGGQRPSGTSRTTVSTRELWGESDLISDFPYVGAINIGTRFCHDIDYLAISAHEGVFRPNAQRVDP